MQIWLIFVGKERIPKSLVENYKLSDHNFQSLVCHILDTGYRNIAATWNVIFEMNLPISPHDENLYFIKRLLHKICKQIKKH